ncbi:hypothetical protein F9L33_09955 [Amylibacter sp. SFDW26]|uniref:hypothetical protein n=1 Tax=Amylibacter sp. SFDW26 TaxID=2652722 RepID=UPI001261ADF7|nr:hypothetical protein [Amylibacter sp. SFDW26]KAB7613690.1 hypothetical protein F9L33_09955 [Amylibacter sp. SFDW26]
MKRIFAISLLIMTPMMLAACDIKTAVPEFDYPKYKSETKWPKLSPTAELEQASDVDVEATIEEIEKLEALAQ